MFWDASYERHPYPLFLPYSLMLFPSSSLPSGASLPPSPSAMRSSWLIVRWHMGPSEL